MITTPINTDEDEHDTDQHTGCPIKNQPIIGDCNCLHSNPGIV